ncbi:MAG TPA: phosphoribosylamine--glycine ligase [Oceanospirillales bacterium]|nr:phosphoribosylamine--glycine ligase [Oceanospirillales bacterium]
MKNKVLVIGSGGREHALAWRLSQSSTVEHVFVAPGNAGTSAEDNVSNIAINPQDFNALIQFCQKENIDLVVVGPEQPLCEGIVDEMSKQGINCFGPSAKAAQLEGSKVYSKQFLQKYAIPTARYASFTDIDKALDYLAKQTLPIVIKADGLAAGKGVVIAQTQQQAQATINDMLAGNAFGEAGHRIVIEEFLQGEEASFIVMVDGENFLAMATSQDHKARDNGDLGPNTGGMGAYSPAPVVTDEIHQEVIQSIIKPTIKGMQAEGAKFVGFLYAGLMIDAQGKAKVLEYNVRFGDPETQPIMLRLQSNLDELCLAAIKGKLDKMSISWDEKVALGVVMAEKGYPDNYTKGSEITGIEAANNLKDCKVFHAGTDLKNDKIITNGGRVLCVCALADDLKTAQKNAYLAVDKIHWNSKYYRTDIGFKALINPAA